MRQIGHGDSSRFSSAVASDLRYSPLQRQFCQSRYHLPSRRANWCVSHLVGDFDNALLSPASAEHGVGRELQTILVGELDPFDAEGFQENFAGRSHFLSHPGTDDESLLFRPEIDPDRNLPVPEFTPRRTLIQV